MKKFVISVTAVVLIIILYFLMNKTPRQIDTLLINGRIYTCNPAGSIEEAVAIQGPSIVGVGRTASLLEIYSARNVIDLKGGTVLPGLIDGHAHILGEGGKLENIDLDGTSSVGQILSLVEKRIKSAKAGDWIVGRGWDQNSWEKKEFPEKMALDKVSPGNPVLLRRVDGHAVWVNSVALRLAGVDESTKDPQGGKILRNPSGNPTGVLIDNAADLVSRIIPELTGEDIERRLLLAMNECASLGLTEVHDMGVDQRVIAVYKKLIDEGRCPIRIYAAIDYPSDTWNQFKLSGPIIEYGGGWLNVRSLKLYMDGALGSRGAAFFDQYNDDKGNRGMTMMGEKEMETVCGEALGRGFQVCTHAIGDRANFITLGVYKKILGDDSASKSDGRWRIEHVQVVSPGDIPLFKRYGILPSMQPTHATSDMDWAEARVGPERISGAYAWRSFLETGAEIIGGSDFPVESVNPFFGIYAAVTRKDQYGNPKDGWYPEQRMTRQEALSSFSEWGAYGAFQEKTKGTLEAGKWADLTVIDRDIMTCEEKEIRSAIVEMTIVAGRTVFLRKEDGDGTKR